LAVLPQPEAKWSTWNILAFLGSGGDGTVNFKVFFFLFKVGLVGYTLLTVRWPLEEITQHLTLVGAILIYFFFRFKYYTFLFNIFLFLPANFSHRNPGITILQLHSVLFACVICKDRCRPAKSDAFRNVTSCTGVPI